jgi:hypothetical protein
MLGGILCAVATTYPLVAQITEAVPTPTPECWDRAECRDVLLGIWMLGEAGRRLLQDPLHLFDANTFHPMRDTLAYSQSMLSATPLVGPLNALTGSPILGYNLYYMFTIVVSVVGIFLLVHEITGNPWAALLAGLLFGLDEDRAYLVAVLPSVAVQWGPWVMYAWLRTLGRPSWLSALGLAGAFVAHVHASAYHGVMLPLLLIPWGLVLLATGRWPVRRWILVGTALGLACVVALALFRPYFVVRDETGYKGRFFGPGVPSARYWEPFARPAKYLASRITDEDEEVPSSSPLPGTFLVLAAGVAMLRRPRPSPRTGERGHLAAALVLWVSAIAVSCGHVIYLRSFEDGWVFGPFHFINMLPGFDAIRIPGRFMILAAMAGAIVAGIALAMVLGRIKTRRVAAWVVGGLALVIIADTRALLGAIPVTTLPGPDDIPAVYRWLGTRPRDTAILELPQGNWTTEAQYTYFSLYHGWRLMNGFSAVMPRYDDALGDFPDPLSLRTLQDAGVSYVLVHLDRFDTALGSVFLTSLQSRLDAQPGLHREMIGDTLVIEVPPAPPITPPVVRGEALDRSSWRLEGSAQGVERAADGSLATHWLTWENESFLRMDLGEPRALTHLTLHFGTHSMEFPRRCQILASLDGVAWEVIVPEQAILPPFASYRRDRRRVEVLLELPGVPARYLQIRGAPRRRALAPRLWGVHEITVHALPKDREARETPTPGPGGSR